MSSTKMSVRLIVCEIWSILLLFVPGRCIVGGGTCKCRTRGHQLTAGGTERTFRYFVIQNGISFSFATPQTAKASS
jgi:hypothetical protein